MLVVSPTAPRLCASQQTIFQTGETGSVWRVLRGTVRLTRTRGPHRLPVQLALPGDLIGTEVLCQRPYQLNAEAFTDCELEAVWTPTGRANSHAAQQTELLSQSLIQQQARSQDMATLRTGSVLQRLSHLLGLLTPPETDPTQPGTHGRAGLPTLREIGELIDAKTETVCRVMAQLRPTRDRTATLAAMPRGDIEPWMPTDDPMLKAA